MKRLCAVCLEAKDDTKFVEGVRKCASCVHNGWSRKISPENMEVTTPSIQDLKRKWERR